MSELKRFDMNGTPHVNGHYCNAQEAADLIERQQARIDELEATVERLRIAALNAISIMPSGQAKADLRDAYDDTPEQNLNNVKREAYVEGYLHGYNHGYDVFALGSGHKPENENDLIEYANTRYPSVKDGE